MLVSGTAYEAPVRCRIQTQCSIQTKNPSEYDIWVIQIADIRRSLQAYEPDRFVADAQTRQAAVAIVVKDASTGSDVMLIKRATVEGDPWSGHMAFPGGHRDPTDKSLRAAAVRETLEETGVSLENAELLGQLSAQIAAPRGRPINMVVVPFVFAIDETPQLAPNHEVEEVVWGPLHEMFDQSLHTTEHRLLGGQRTPFNGYRLNGRHFVWGLTYRTLQTLFGALDSDYLPPAEPA